MRLVAAWLLLLSASQARAQSPQQRESPSADPEAELGEVERPSWWNRAYPPRWAEADDRWFISGALDVGFLYVRPRVSAGWGRPHFRWFGIDVNPIFQQNNIGAYAGFRITSPFVDWRIGGRYNLGLNGSYLEPKQAYGPRDFNIDNGTNANYLTLETELTLTLPAGPGQILSETAVSYVLGVPDGYYLLENIIRVAVAPPWVSRNRLGYVFALLDGALQLGLVGELVYVPGRELLIVRAGVLLRININARIQIRASWIPAINSPDQMGIRGGDFGLLGLRYRFASGSTSD